MQKMSNLDYYYALKEFTTPTRFVKAYAIDDNTFRLKFNSQDAGEANLLIELGVRTHFTQYLPEKSEENHFVKTMRRLLENAVVKNACLLNFDRIIEIELEKKEKYFLIIEMLSEGNLVLCDARHTIIDCLKSEDYSVRTIRKGRPYSPPPSNGMHPSEITPTALEGKKGKLIQLLSKAVNLSPFYLEEACALAGISPKQEASELSESEVKKIIKACAGLLEHNPTTPIVYYENDKPTAAAFAPFELKKLEGMRFEPKASFSKALEEYYRANTVSPEHAAREEKLKKLEHVLAQQNESVEKMLAEAREKQAAGEWIYANTERAQEEIEKAKKERKREAEIEIS